MEHDARKYLWDARDAAEAIAQFTRDTTWEGYEQDRMLRSAVERQFEIIGEALGQLARIQPDLARQVPELSRIVAFRNLLIHGYAVVDDRTVWRLVQERLPGLRATLDRLLDGPDRPGE